MLLGVEKGVNWPMYEDGIKQKTSCLGGGEGGLLL